MPGKIERPRRWDIIKRTRIEKSPDESEYIVYVPEEECLGMTEPMTKKEVEEWAKKKYGYGKAQLRNSKHSSTYPKIFINDPALSPAKDDYDWPSNESLKKSNLVEDDEFDIDDLDLDFEDEEVVEEEPEQYDDLEDSEEDMENEMIRKTIQFPILIEGYNEDDESVSMDRDDEVNYAQTYGDAVVENIEQNKKFIISALGVYDIEMYYDSYDKNSNVKFVISCDQEINNQSLMNVLKRYFNVTVDNEVTDEGEFTLTPVLDNKFIKIM